MLMVSIQREGIRRFEYCKKEKKSFFLLILTPLASWTSWRSRGKITQNYLRHSLTYLLTVAMPKSTTRLRLLAPKDGTGSHYFGTSRRYNFSSLPKYNLKSRKYIVRDSYCYPGGSFKTRVKTRLECSWVWWASSNLHPTMDQRNEHTFPFHSRSIRDQA